MQHEITKAIPLLDERGNLTEPGYAKRLLPVYDRTKVKGGFARLKEWDYYYVGNDRFGAVDCAEEVDVKLFFGFLRAGKFHCAGYAEACVGDQHIDTPFPGNDRIHRGFYRGGIRHIRGNMMNGTAFIRLS